MSGVLVGGLIVMAAASTVVAGVLQGFLPDYGRYFADGTRFFYENPLASLGGHHRQDWFGCSCCPPNISRLLASLGGYVASTAPGALSIDLIVGGTIATAVDGAAVRVDVATDHPWDGTVALTLSPASPQRFRLRLRIPAWCSSWRLRVGGAAVRPRLRGGYAELLRTWKPGDRVELVLDMPARRVHADPRVRQDAGRVAIARGPLVYCLEACDNGGDLDAVLLPDGAAIRPRRRPDLLGGVVALHAAGRRERPFAGGLYRDVPPESGPAPLAFVPYCVWDNRRPGAMAVWVRRGQGRAGP